VDVKAGLGGIEMRDAIEMYQEIQIQPRQNQISSKFNEILRLNDIDAEVSIDPLQPATFILSDDLMKLSHTVNEIRSLSNTPELLDENGELDEKGDKLLIEVENGQSNQNPDGGSES